MHPRYACAALFAAAVPALTVHCQVALDFDGQNDQVTVPGASATIAGSPALTMACWVYPRTNVVAFPDLDGYAGFRNEGDADFYIVQLYNNALEGRFRNSAGAAYTVTTPSGVALNTWQHVALTFDGSTLRIWMNGAVAASTPASGAISSTSVAFTMGNINFNAQPFWLNGRLDEVALWRRALSAAELECLGNGPVDPNDPDLALYFDFEQGVPGGSNASLTTLPDATGSVTGQVQSMALSGTGSNFVGGVPFGTAMTAQICPGGTYTFNGQVLTAPGIYTTSYATGGACDSTVVLTLTQTAVNTGAAQNANLLIAQATGAQYQWINCLTQAPISNATAQYYTATANGQYAVVVTQNGCSDTSACFTVTTASIEDRMLPTARLWPQPVGPLLNVELAWPLEQAVLRINDITGRKVLERAYPMLHRTVLSTEELPAGAFLLSVEAQGDRRVIRFVRE